MIEEFEDCQIKNVETLKSTEKRKKFVNRCFFSGKLAEKAPKREKSKVIGAFLEEREQKKHRKEREVK